MRISANIFFFFTKRWSIRKQINSKRLIRFLKNHYVLLSWLQSIFSWRTFRSTLIFFLLLWNIMLLSKCFRRHSQIPRFLRNVETTRQNTSIFVKVVWRYKKEDDAFKNELTSKSSYQGFGETAMSYLSC